MIRSHSRWSFRLDHPLPKINRHKKYDATYKANIRHISDRELENLSTNQKKVLADMHHKKQRSYNKEIIQHEIDDLD